MIDNQLLDTEAPTVPHEAVSPITKAEAFCDVEGHGAYIAKTYHVIPGQPPATTRCPLCDRAAKAAGAWEGRNETERQATQRREWEAGRVRLRQRLGDLARLPAMFAECTVHGYLVGEDPGRAAARNVITAFGRDWETKRRTGGMLLLCGKTGTGKTHLAAALINHVTRSDPHAVAAYGTVAQIMRWIRAHFSRDAGRSEDQAHADLLDVDLLVIDEIGASGGSDHERNTLFELLNARYANNRAVIGIANYTPEELASKELLGERVMSRFRQKGHVVGFTWNDYRVSA